MLAKFARRVIVPQLPRKAWTSPPLGPDSTPIEALEQNGKLRRGQPKRPVRRLRPDERAAFELLVDQNEPGLIPHQTLHAIAAFRAEHEQRAAVRVVSQDALHDQRKARMPLAENRPAASPDTRA